MITISRKKPAAILWCINLGFVGIILLSWLDEILRLPYLLFGGVASQGNWQESLMESLLAIVIWVITYLYARRIIQRVYYLEGFLTVCAWCRKIRFEDKWIPLEEFFASGLQTKTSHGMCPTCSRELTNKPKPSK